MVLGFFKLDVGVIAEVDLLYRTIRSDEKLLTFLGVKLVKGM